jgi:type II secretory pathway pseudopilin PulG
VTTSGRGDFFQSVRGLALALTALALLAFVLPSWLAARLQRGRVARADAQVRTVAARLAASGLADIRRTAAAQNVAVLTGPGDPVLDAADQRWRSARQAPLQSYVRLPAEAVTPDPWLRALQIEVGGPAAGSTVWVLSAGPNGIIDTPFDPADGTIPSGDDVAAPVR